MERRIPTLEEVFEVLPEDSLINIGIKDVDVAEECVRIVRNFDAGDRVLIRPSTSIPFAGLENL